ncbi:mCG13105, isoform CRA_a [Mus musculus]|nr:mCG13105, isoform CRA_a [Mus musculus]
MQLTKPVSDENITVIDTDFSDIPVRLYLPKRKSERQRPAVIYIHGGAFTLGSCKMLPYDYLNRWTANKLDAVVVGIDYRLAPQYPFPAALEDCVLVIKYFLQDTIVTKYGVDPTRICISEDSSGGTLATAATQMVCCENGRKRSLLTPANSGQFPFLVKTEAVYTKHSLPFPTVFDFYISSCIFVNLQNNSEHKIKAQALLYPGLQFIDTLMPSHRDYEYGPFLSRETAMKLACLYVTEDTALPQAMKRNEHMPKGSRHLFNFVNWSDFLPEKYKKNYVYTEPTLGKLNVFYPALVDSRLSPLLVNDSQLQSLPLTYILTCEHDFLRDDGLIYITWLRNVGVQVTHDHLEEGIHGAISLITEPYNLHVGLTIRDKYISWLEKNL